ncbi:replication protein A, partial [Shinella daejeonensis]|nr:replication protein A [Shinella daejeonensis]
PFTVWQEALTPHATRTETVTPANFEERARDVEKLIRGAARSLSVAAKKSIPTAQSGPRRASGDRLSSEAGDLEVPRLPLDPPGGRR